MGKLIDRPAVLPDHAFPTSDGKPMAETDTHRRLMTDLIATLADHFAPRPDVYVSGNLLVCYDPTDKRRHLAPDVFVAFGVPGHTRDNYLLWREGKGPDVVIELTSASTARDDRGRKWELYRSVLKVSEYFLFSPLKRAAPRLEGHRLSRGRYLPLRPDGDRLPSDRLGLLLEADGDQLRLVDPATGRRLPTPHERAVAADQRAVAADERAETAEAEAARLRAELARLTREA